MKTFNPEQYQSYQELPEDEKENFEEVTGGFVRKEAAELLRRAGEVAKEANENRPLLKKVFKVGALNAVDALQDAANFEFRKDISDLYDGVMSISLWERITKEEFEQNIRNVIDEVKREEGGDPRDPVGFERGVYDYFKEKSLRFAQWLEDTKNRPFFARSNSTPEVERVIDKIRDMVSSL